MASPRSSWTGALDQTVAALCDAPDSLQREANRQ